MRDDSDGFNEPYLPERYKEIVRKKKQRRLLKKIGVIAVLVFAVVVAFVVISGFFNPSPGPAPVSSPPVTPAPTTPPATAAAATTAPARPATTAVSTTVTAPAVSTTTADTAAVTTTAAPEPVLTARAALYATPKENPNPSVTETQAEGIARAAFPGLPAGDMSAELVTSPDFGLVWKYTLRADTTIEATGFVDAESGQVLTFNRTVHPGARSQNPVLSMANARQIADSTLNSRNSGILSINMSNGKYIPLSTPGGNVAGTYRFVYDRMVQDYPCDSDGFVVSVDALSGAVTEYVQRWQSPDNAFMIAEQVVIPRYDATYTVQAKAKSIYPASISGLRIISSEIRWKDRHDPAALPRPSTIPLGWKIVFDDDIMRAKASPTQAVGWVDVQNGDLIEMTYQH